MVNFGSPDSSALAAAGAVGLADDKLSLRRAVLIPLDGSGIA